jgi:hypothetical protein
MKRVALKMEVNEYNDIEEVNCLTPQIGPSDGPLGRGAM